ncbi:MAG: NfuA family Fe-S biogenesis protein [Xanthomonadaceae bacterium]|nr:NfuA family Fe-S biogenesis protein [Xanthomonadaceae bacterium]
MLTLTESAQRHFHRLIEQQGIAGLGVRMQALHPGTPKADCRLEFCESSDLTGGEWELACAGFNLYVDALSMPYLEDAEVDYANDATGGQLIVRAPKLKGSPPAHGASLAERVRYVLDTEVNPQIAAHGGRATLVEITEEKAVILRLGGGCHGCGMADVTLKQGIERTLREHFPEISAVRDATDHASGNNPYYRGHEGRSALNKNL